MLKRVRDLLRFSVQAKDGDFGHCRDFLFDDRHWVIRYLVVDTGGWLPGKKVLISPLSFKKPNWDEKIFPVNLKKAQIREAPGLDTEETVSRQYEREYFDYYRYPFYWSGAGIWGSGAYPNPVVDEEVIDELRSKMNHGKAPEPKSHLRSMKEVMGYGVHSSTGRFGHVDDFVVDDKSWRVAYLIVDTVNILPSKSVFVPRDRVSEVDWFERTVSIDLPKEVIKDSPAVDDEAPIGNEFQYEVDRYYHLV